MNIPWNELATSEACDQMVNYFLVRKTYHAASASFSLLFVFVWVLFSLSIDREKN